MKSFLWTGAYFFYLCILTVTFIILSSSVVFIIFPLLSSRSLSMSNF
jgi:hypothetical protein